MEAYCTTGQFAGLGRGYRQHCGPTAAANLLRALLGAEAPPPETLFLAAAELAQRRMSYVNAELLGRWGGTSDLLCRSWLRALLDRYGLQRIRLGPREAIRPDLVWAALDRGSLLYLQLRRHPKYGNHHLLCCGRRADGALRLADGWSAAPVFSSLRDLGRGHFIEIRIA